MILQLMSHIMSHIIDPYMDVESSQHYLYCEVVDEFRK
jgi:hypothetical protein